MSFKPSWRNINEFMSEKADKLKDKVMITVSEDSSKITYEEFNKISNKSANMLLDLGIKKGDIVSIVCYNVKEYLFVLFGCLKIGATLNPINPKLTSEEYEYILKDSGAKIVFANQESIEKINSVKDKCKNLRHVFGVEELDKKLDRYDNNLKNQDVNLDDEALLMYSSGTTGNPKGILLTQGNIFYEAYGVSKHFSMNEDTIFFGNLPLFFSGGLFPSFFAPLFAGGSCVLIKKFSKSRFWSIASRFKITNTYCVPTMLSMLLNPPEEISGYDISNIRCIFSGAAYVPSELIKQFEKTFGIKIYVLYGLTENSAICSGTPYKGKRKIESIGVPLETCEMKIFGKDNNELEAGKEGEIVIKGGIVTKGYHNNPEASEKALRNGWLHSGDLGYMDEEGYFYYTGRAKELIIKGGENISPVQIDDVFYKHPKVADCATIGVSDKIYGEEIVSYVILKEGEKVSENELKKFCKKHISEFKCPKEIIFTDEIPKTASGKLMRRKLARMYEQGN